MNQPAITPATLQFTAEGIPYSSAFDDVYHSPDGGLAQAQHVFLAGNDLPTRWQRQARFVIAETGFGIGLNFLATWAAWQDDPQRAERLHFISVEQFPFRADDLASLHTQLFAGQPKLLDLSAELRAKWPQLVAGIHRLHLDQGRVTLTLALGDANHWLGQIAAKVDAFYLDGFAPAKNPDLWQVKLFKQFARLATTGATLATYTVAGEVRRGLEAAGFVLSRRPGFGRKLEMLSGVFRAERPRSALPDDRHAVIIGAGLAGASLAARLAVRGWRVTMLEQHAAPALAASGNHVGALRPVVSADDNLQARLARAAFLYGNAGLDTLGDTVLHQRCGALQLARDADEDARFQHIAASQQHPSDYLKYVDQAAASQLAGQALSSGGLWFAQGGWVSAASLVLAQLALAGEQLDLRCNSQVASLQHDGERWRLYDDQQQLLASAAVVILANAADANRFAPELPLGRDQRWLSYLAAEHAPALQTVVCRGGYITPAVQGTACVGSSMVRDDDLATAQAANLDILAHMLPQTAGHPIPSNGRLCSRPGTPDWLPIAGPLGDLSHVLPKHAGSLHLAPRHPGLYTLTGFGARGLLWCQLLAELVACQIHGEPLPLERELVTAVDPLRFYLRGLA